MQRQLFILGIIIKKPAGELIKKAAEIFIFQAKIKRNDVFIIEVEIKSLQQGRFSDILIAKQGEVLPIPLFKIRDPFLKQAKRIFSSEKIMF